MTSTRYWRSQICSQLESLDEIWSSFTLDTSTATSIRKLEEWRKETDKILRTIGKNNGLEPVSRLVTETVDDPISSFQEQVKKYRVFLSLLIKELDRAQSLSESETS